MKKILCAVMCMGLSASMYAESNFFDKLLESATNSAKKFFTNNETEIKKKVSESPFVKKFNQESQKAKETKKTCDDGEGCAESVFNLVRQSVEESNPGIKSISQDVGLLYKDGLEKGALEIIDGNNQKISKVKLLEAWDAMPGK
ncbi:MAG: hypothetical protein ACON5A_06090 [Candidatus Comchoanobacterales bacterium]